MIDNNTRPESLRASEADLINKGVEVYGLSAKEARNVILLAESIKTGHPVRFSKSEMSDLAKAAAVRFAQSLTEDDGHKVYFVF